MKERNRDPHPFDMSNYLQGLTFVVGGKDIDKDEKELIKEQNRSSANSSYKLDWSFLKKNRSFKKRSR